MARNATSIVLFTHNEGLLIHKTLLSIQQLAADSGQAIPEVIIAAWQPDYATQDYLAHCAFKIQVLVETTGHISSLLNKAAKACRNNQVVYMRAGDLLGGRWLDAAPESAISFPEYTINFGVAPMHVTKTYVSPTLADDTLLLTGGDWHSDMCLVSRETLLAYPFSEQSSSFEQALWHFRAQLNQAGLQQGLLPQTALWTRKAAPTLSALGQCLPGLDIANVRAITLGKSWPQPESTAPPTVTTGSSLKNHLKRAAARHPATQKAARVVYHLAKKAHHTLARRTASAPSALPVFPDWLVAAWQAMPAIDKATFITTEAMAQASYSETPDMSFWRTGSAYKALLSATHHDKYDYIFFVPWLIEGGGDIVTIRYANTLHKLKASWRIAVIATENRASKWQRHLDPGIDFLDFGIFTRGLVPKERNQIMEHFIEQSEAKYLHIISSMFGFDFVGDRAAYFSTHKRQVIGTFFSQSKDTDGRIYGYSHSDAPKLYPANALYTTDNQLTKQMWVAEYGFEVSRIFVHDQPVDIPEKPWQVHSAKNKFRVLWASRLSPEKQPHILAAIAQELKDLPIEIDMYGSTDDFDMASLERMLPSSVHYKRSFKGFSDLPYGEYDAFLYTSLFDGMPNIVLEAGAAGMPLITSNVGGVPALVQNGHNGFLVDDLTNPEPYVSALRQVYQDDGFAKQIGAQLRTDVIDSHSWKSYEAAVDSFIKHLQS